MDTAHCIFSPRCCRTDSQFAVCCVAVAWTRWIVRHFNITSNFRSLGIRPSMWIIRWSPSCVVPRPGGTAAPAGDGTNAVWPLCLEHSSGLLTLPNHTQATGTVMAEGSVDASRAYTLEADDLTSCWGCPRKWLVVGGDTLTGAKWEQSAISDCQLSVSVAVWPTG